MLGQRFKGDGGLPTIALRIEGVGVFGDLPRKRRLPDPVAPLGQKFACAPEIDARGRRSVGHYMLPIPPARCAPASLSMRPVPPPISGTVKAWLFTT
jgi:hypothetical protein